MSASGFPKCFSGSRPGTHVGRDTYEYTQSNTQRQKYKHKHHCKQTNVCTDRERERERGRIRNTTQWLKMTGREVYGQSHKHTCKPAPWIYLFDFASSVHRSLRVRATVFSCWPQTPPHNPSPTTPTPTSSLWEHKLWKEILFIWLSPPLPLKWCMEVTHRNGSEKKKGKRRVVESFVCISSGATLLKYRLTCPQSPDTKTSKSNQQPASPFDNISKSRPELKWKISALIALI